MCDYCDRRSHPQIAALSADHEVLLRLLADLDAAVDTNDHGRARTTLDRVHGILDDHAGREERGVFTQLRRADVDDTYVPRFEHDHRVLHDLVGQIDQPGWQTPLQAFVALLRDHIAREESDLFPAAHQLLEPRQWDAVDAATTPGGTR